jgi:ribonuclease HII
MPFEPLPAAFQHLRHIAGVDEVGRGPLAGPVVAAAVILGPNAPSAHLADSKALAAIRREELALLIGETCQVGIAMVTAGEIDRLNIRQASLLAMRRAVLALPHLPDAALIDGRDVPEGLPCPALALIKGDARQASIAAASIVAKVMRDQLMTAAETHFAGYGFATSAGYPTPRHKAALVERGITPLHRLSFAPCRLAQTQN